MWKTWLKGWECGKHSSISWYEHHEAYHFSPQNPSQKHGFNALHAACIPTVADASSGMHSDPSNPLRVYVILFSKWSQGDYNIPRQGNFSAACWNFSVTWVFSNTWEELLSHLFVLKCGPWLVQKEMLVKWGSGGDKVLRAGTNQIGLFSGLLN